MTKANPPTTSSGKKKEIIRELEKLLSDKKRKVYFNAFNNVEIFKRLHGRLPESKDEVTKEDYQKYCDMVMAGETFKDGGTYEPDGLWEFALEESK